MTEVKLSKMSVLFSGALYKQKLLHSILGIVLINAYLLKIILFCPTACPKEIKRSEVTQELPT